MTRPLLASQKSFFVLYKDSTKQQKVPCKAINFLPRRQTLGLWLVLLTSLFLLSGCGNLARLAKDIRETGDQLRVVSGRISAPVCKDCEIIIAVSGDDQGQEIHNYRVFERSGNFRLAALRDSRFLIAFQDLNQDFSYQANEPAVWYKLTESKKQKATNVLNISS